MTKPSGTVDGDWLYAFCWFSSTSAVAATISGWTQVYYSGTGTGPVLTILKRNASSEGANYSVACSTASSASVNIVTYRGGAGDVDVVGVIARTASGSNTVTASTITATVGGVLLAGFFHADGATASTPPSGMTVQSTQGTGVTSHVYDLVQAAGSTGTKAIVWSTSVGVNGAILMQIK